MTTQPTLSGSHQRTYDKLFQHPVTHNLEWHDVLTMLSALGEVNAESNSHLVISRHGHRLMLHRPHTKDITDIHEVMEIRHFLERSETPFPEAGSPGRVLVVLSHHEARLFQTEEPGAAAEKLKSHESRYFGHETDSKEDSRGRENPATSSFFEPLAAALKDARQILLFGSGSGHASEMDRFATWLKKYHPAVAARIVGTVVVDEHHQSDGELLAKARDFYAHPAPAAV